ncbi:MAG: hypothetical protein AB7O59_01915 [Pirellulales bacterium]
MLNQIEKLKKDYTDKYVVVDAGVPELARFAGYVGQVKTVNMSGRALVQFEAWNNIGWYDIDLGFLKVVPKPAAAAEGKAHEAAPKTAKPAAKAADAKPAAATTGEKKLSPLEMARLQGAAKGGGAAAAPAAPKAKPAAPAAGGKQSTADILAAARANKAATAAAAAPAAPAVAAPSAAAAAPVAPAAAPAAATGKPAATIGKPAAAAAKPAAAQTALPAGQRPSVPQILAWCREHDAK